MCLEQEAVSASGPESGLKELPELSSQKRKVRKIGNRIALVEKTEHANAQGCASVTVSQEAERRLKPKAEQRPLEALRGTLQACWRSAQSRATAMSGDRIELLSHKPKHRNLCYLSESWLLPAVPLP